MISFVDFLLESNLSKIKNFNPKIKNFLGDDKVISNLFIMIYELEYKLHMMSQSKYLGSLERKKITYT
jgi:hypothetical protein